jgi:EmrB/QacA subfamily drug resistance transporter
MESFPIESNGPTPSLADDPALGLSHRAKMEILFAVLLALFLGALDQTIVGTALPQIVTDLGGNQYYNWVVTIYLLTSTITVPFYGKLSDLYGRKPLLMIGITIFLIGSALSGLSQTMWQLILFRGIQGIGAGALFPISLAVIGDLFSPAERGRYQGLFGAVFGVAFIVGPFLGGTLTDLFSWHWIFYINIPIGIVSLFVIWRLLPNISHPERQHSLDFLGAGVFAAAVTSLLVGLTNKQSLDWGVFEVGGLLAIAAVLGVLFVFIEARAKEPIVPLDLWRNREYAVSVVTTFLISVGFFGAIIFIPRWFQVVQGVSATESGYQMFPLLIGLIGSSIISGMIISRTGRYRELLVGSVAVMALGMLLLTNVTADTELPIFWLWMFIAGVGIGPSLAGFTIVVQNAVPFSKLGVATSNLTFFRQIGGSIGLAVVGTVFGTALVDKLPGAIAPVAADIEAAAPPQFQGQLEALASSAGSGSLDLNQFTGVGQSFGTAVVDAASANVPAQAQPLVEQFLAPFVPQLDHAFFEAFSAAMGQAFFVGVLATLVALGTVVFLRGLPLRTTNGPAEATASSTPERPASAGVGRRVAETPAFD